MFGSELPKRVEVFTIGDELLDGRVADTNTLRLAVALQDLGVTIAHRTSVLDDIGAIVQEAKNVVARKTQLCIVSGGLGPTTDDLTSEAFAQLCDVELVRDAEQEQKIRAYLQRRGRSLTENQLKQADRPQGAVVLSNPAGTAPGFALLWQGCWFVSVPGVPKEFDVLMENYVLTPLRKLARPMAYQQLMTFGIIEAEVDKLLNPIHERWTEVRVGYRVKFPEIQVTLKSAMEYRADVDAAHAFAKETLGLHVVSESERGVPETLLELLQKRQLTVAVAESCTGGLVLDLLTNIAGSSNAVRGGVVAYANDVKETLLGVDAGLLREHGAVSEEVAKAMADGVRRRLGSDWGIAVTGIAGPDGGTPDKPVGTVWCAISSSTHQQSKKLQLPFDRRFNKLVSAYSALDMVRRCLKGIA